MSKECVLCKALEKEKKKFLFENERIVILPTKNMKGHHKRIMIITKEHVATPHIVLQRSYLRVFREFCKEYFDEQPTYALVESTYATIPGHWHKIACDWYGTEKEKKQLLYTPHQALKTNVGWKP